MAEAETPGRARVFVGEAVPRPRSRWPRTERSRARAAELSDRDWHPEQRAPAAPDMDGGPWFICIERHSSCMSACTCTLPTRGRCYAFKLGTGPCIRPCVSVLVQTRVREHSPTAGAWSSRTVFLFVHVPLSVHLKPIYLALNSRVAQQPDGSGPKSTATPRGRHRQEPTYLISRERE